MQARTKNIILCSSILLLFACQKKPEFSQTGGGDFDLENVQAPVLAEFNPGKQNAIFRDILTAVQAQSCQEQASGPSQARLLSNEEIATSLSSVFGKEQIEPTLWEQLMVETKVLGFPALQGFHLMSPDRLQAYLQFIDRLATALAQSHSSWMGCTIAENPGCFTKWLEEKLPLVWRRPVERSEIDAVQQIFISAGQNEQGLVAAIQRVFLSPYFLYRSELGINGSLDSYELAESLSYVIWGSSPDQELLKLAQNDAFQNQEFLKEKIKDMIQDERFWNGLHLFVTSWLENDRLLNSSKMLENQFDVELKKDLALEASDFLYYLVRNDSDDFQSIFTADFTIGSSRMASFYNLIPEGELVQNQRPLSKLKLAGDTRGLSNQPGLVASLTGDDKTHIAARGSFLLSKMMCNILEIPPISELSGTEPITDPNLSERQKLAHITSSGSCAACHKFINGPGFAMEELDAFGRLRNQDDAFQPIDSSTELHSILGGSSQITGAAGLSEALGQSLEAELCFVTQLFRHSYGRLETQNDVCTIANTYMASKVDGLKIKDVYMHLLTSRSFLNRKQ